MSDSLADSLAERVINQLQEETNSGPSFSNQWGIDEVGFYWPNPVNAQAVAARIFMRHKAGEIFRVGDDVFVKRKRINQDKGNLLVLCGHPEIILWANLSEDPEKPGRFWKQIKNTISSEHPLIWSWVKEVAPEYSKDYIRIGGDLVWGKEEADILFWPEGGV